jgi:hypothetical protein
MMPERRHTRTQQHAGYVADQRRLNHHARQTRHTTCTGREPPDDNDKPPPF